jgi:serine/threonine protein phosphatase 1
MVFGRGKRGEGDGPVLVAVGDVHGRADLLAALLLKLERLVEGREARFVFLGDYVDRGPDSRGVIDALLELRRRRPDTVFLKGNHEEALLDFLAEPEEGGAWLEWGGEVTLASYGVDADPPWDLEDLRDRFAHRLSDRHFVFLMNLARTHEEAGYLFVHAGLNPDLAIEEQRDRDLFWIRDAWHQGGKGRFPDHVVVHGHTPVDKPEDLSWRINVDTGAVWTSKLTAVILDGTQRRFVTA